VPAKSTPIATAAAASADPSSGRQESDLTAPAQQPTADFPSDSDGESSPAERLAAERTERRRQRAVAHETPTPARAPRGARRRARATKSTRALRPPGRLTLRDSMSVNLIGVLVAGGVLGAILGALSAAGWVIGLLVAGLTVVLSAVLRSYQRST
jgi:hypothetical protein